MLRRFILLLPAITICVSICLAQKPSSPPPSPSASKGDSNAWKEFLSPEGRFSVLFPGTPITNDDPIDTRAGRIPAYSYAVTADTALYVVGYANMPGEAPGPDATKRMLDGGRDRMLSSDKKMKLISEKDISLGEYPGREFLTHDEESLMRSRGYVVGSRVYNLLLAMPKKLALRTPGNFAVRTDLFETISRQFLDSFKVTESDAPLGEVDQMLRELKEQKKDVMVVGGTTGSSAHLGTSAGLVSPSYPALARSAHASGPVSVKVLIDLEGNVIAAQVVDGHPLLRAAAIKAARESTFLPTKLNGKPVMVMGIIIYNFVANNRQ